MKDSDIPSILKDFIDYLSIKNYSKETISLYTYDLMDFFKFIKFYKRINIEVKKFSNIIIYEIQSDDIISYLYFLVNTKENLPATRYRKYCEIKIFFDWLTNLSPTFENPALNLVTIKSSKKLPKHLNLTEAKKIQTIFNKHNSKFPLRNNTIITFFLSTGVRVSELKNINLEDVDFKNKTVYIKEGKGKKDRIVYINGYCQKQLLKYINSKKIIELGSPLFTNKQNTRLSRRSIEVICENAFKLLGVENKHYTTHSLRHTMATITYNHVKPDILLIKKILGHSSISSTEIYTHINNARVKKAVESHPLANFYSSKEGRVNEN